MQAKRKNRLFPALCGSRADKPQGGFFRRHYYRAFPGRMQGKSRFRDHPGRSSSVFPAAFPFLPLIRKPDQTLSRLSPARRASGFLRRRGVPAARRQRAERMGSERASFKIRISPSPVGRWRRCLPRRAAPCWAGRRRSSGSREWRLRRAPVPWTCRSPGRR